MGLNLLTIYMHLVDCSYRDLTLAVNQFHLLQITPAPVARELFEPANVISHRIAYRAQPIDDTEVGGAYLLRQ